MSTVTEGSGDLARETGRSAGKIGLSIIVSIGLGYVLTVACARLLQPAEYTVFITFWGLLMGLGSTLSPLEQELSRQSAVAALDGGRAGKPALRSITVGMALVVLVSLATMFPAINERLFHGHFALSVLVLAGGVAFACQFGVRGLLIGQHQVKPFSWLVIAEAAARAVVLGIVVLAAVNGLFTLALAVAAGSFAWLLFIRPARKLLDPRLDGDSWPVVTRRMLLLIGGAALTASVITGYPAMVGLLAPGGDATRLGALFAALTVARVPLLLLQPLQSMAVPLVIRLSTNEDGRHRLRKVLATGTVGALVLAAVGSLAGLLVGAWVVRLVYGGAYQVEGWAVAGLVWSAVLLVPTQLLTSVLVARTQANKVLVTWAVVAVSAAAVLLFWPGDTVLRAVIALAAGPTLGLIVVLAFVLRRPPGTSHERATDAGSPTGCDN
jgi:O-antigen/teichoic acid export membrane protein